MQLWILGAYIFSYYSFHFLQVNTQKWSSWVIWLFPCLIFEKLSYCFPYWLHHFTFQLEVSLDSLSSTSSPAFVIYKFLIMALVTRERWYHLVVLICFSLIVSDVEHLFICLLAICISSSEKSLQVLCPFNNHILPPPPRLSCVSSYIFWILTSYQTYHLHFPVFPSLEKVTPNSSPSGIHSKISQQIF